MNEGRKYYYRSTGHMLDGEADLDLEIKVEGGEMLGWYFLGDDSVLHQKYPWNLHERYVGGNDDFTYLLDGKLEIVYYD